MPTHSTTVIATLLMGMIGLLHIGDTEPPAPPSAHTVPTAPTTPAQPTSRAATPAFHTGTEARHERFNRIAKEGTAQLVFLGDSITQGWEGAGKDAWAAHYAQRDAANFGIGGDRTEHVLWRIEHGNFDGLKPRLIVLMIGTNNAGARKDPPADTAAGIEAILDRLAIKCPDAKVLLLAIFPRGQNSSDAMRTINDGVNTRLGALADNQRVFFKDIGATFLNADGSISKDIMPDLLHLSPRGYDLWAKAIEADVAKLMGETK